MYIMLNNLLNCPCCGHAADFIKLEKVHHKDYGQIACLNAKCFICTPFGSYDYCKSIWNNRVNFDIRLLDWL